MKKVYYVVIFLLGYIGLEGQTGSYQPGTLDWFGAPSYCYQSIGSDTKSQRQYRMKLERIDVAIKLRYKDIDVIYMIGDMVTIEHLNQADTDVCVSKSFEQEFGDSLVYYKKEMLPMEYEEETEAERKFIRDLERIYSLLMPFKYDSQTLTQSSGVIILSEGSLLGSDESEMVGITYNGNAITYEMTDGNTASIDLSSYRDIIDNAKPVFNLKDHQSEIIYDYVNYPNNAFHPNLKKYRKGRCTWFTKDKIHICESCHADENGLKMHEFPTEYCAPSLPKYKQLGWKVTGGTISIWYRYDRFEVEKVWEWDEARNLFVEQIIKP